MIKKYKTKPVEIEAVEFTEELALKLFSKEVEPIFGEFSPSGSYHLEDKKVWDAYILIDTLEGRMKVSLGDFIIKGLNGEFYPCKPDIFHKKYEEITN